MANLTIVELTEILAAGVTNTDLLPLWDDTASETKKITIAQFKTLIAAVESVGASSPLSSTGGLTPVISISQANTTTDGYLSSTDWNTFNGKQDLLVSGTNIKTINGSSILGAGNLTIGTTNWSETFSSATQATSQWTPLNAAANVNAAITPKGTGALVAQIPTGTTVGGNARGTYAVDFQMVRNNANQVASGSNSAIIAGVNSQVTGNNSFSGSGATSVISGSSSGIVAGTSNTVSGNNSFIGAGQSNTITSADSFVGGGISHTISAQYGTIGGGANNTVSGRYGGALSGRQNNTQGGDYNLIAGGFSNTISFAGFGNDTGRVIVGGSQNTISLGGNEHASIVGGNNNFIGVLASYAFLGGGRNNSCTGADSTLVGGNSNRIGNGSYQTATQCFLGGGQSNIIEVNSTYSVLAGGQSNQVTASFASILGGQGGIARLYGQQSYAAGGFSAAGDAQAHELIWRRLVTGTTITELFLDGASIAAILPATNALWQGTIEIAAICTVVGNGTTTLGDAQGTSYKVTIKRLGATTTLVGTVQEIGTTNADPSALGVFTIDANNTNESLRIQFTPPPSAGSTTVHRVVATFRGLQIQY